MPFSDYEKNIENYSGIQKGEALKYYCLYFGHKKTISIYTLIIQ